MTVLEGTLGSLTAPQVLQGDSLGFREASWFTGTEGLQQGQRPKRLTQDQPPPRQLGWQAQGLCMEPSRNTTPLHGSPQASCRPGIPFFLFALLLYPRSFRSSPLPFLPPSPETPHGWTCPIPFISPTVVDSSSVLEILNSI